MTKTDRNGAATFGVLVSLYGDALALHWEAVHSEETFWFAEPARLAADRIAREGCEVRDGPAPRDTLAVLARRVTALAREVEARGEPVSPVLARALDEFEVATAVARLLGE